MKMAKASQADLDMADELAWILFSLEKGVLPTALEGLFPDGGFDTDNHEHLREVVGLILRTLEKGSLFRVTTGMQVVCDPRNKLLDPNADTLEAHPDIACGAEMLGQLLAELRSAHQIIRNALNLMTTEQKTAWGMANARDGVDGDGITRASERSDVIIEASACVLRLSNPPVEVPMLSKVLGTDYAPDNPPRLRKTGESVEEYRAAMGWSNAETEGGAA